jgi:hypothetical protein
MKVQMQSGAVPFVVTYRKILKKPQLKRSRHFVGPVRFFKNLLVKAIEAAEDAAFETKIETIEPGQSVAVHWAYQVEDPWDVPPGREARLIGTRMMGDKPPSGAHFEIVSSPRDEELSPEAAAAAQTQRVRQHIQNTHQHPHAHPEGNGRFHRPADAAYAPRPVAPLDLPEEDIDALTSNLDRPELEN